MGEVQLEILHRADRVALRSARDLRRGQHRLPGDHRRRRSIGMGHFEPLRHYAEVHLLHGAAASAGSGITLASACSTDELDLNWQRLILTHLAEKAHLGRADRRAADRCAHHTHRRAARTSSTPRAAISVQATYRAVRKGLMQAREHSARAVLRFHARAAGRMRRPCNERHSAHERHI